MADRVKHRPALGQVVQIGTLYDAVTDSFLPESLFDTGSYRTHRDVIQSRYSSIPKETRTIEPVANAYADKFKLLGIPLDLGASIIAGLLDLDGAGCDSAAFVAQPSTGSLEGQAAVLHRSTLMMETIKLKSKHLGRSIDRDLLHHPVATHVVAAVDWGIENIVNISLPSGGASVLKDRSSAPQIVQKAAEALKSSIAPAASQTPLPTPAQEYDITVYSNILPSLVKTNNLEDAAKADRQATVLAQQPGGAQMGPKPCGKPFKYRLMSIEDVRNAVGDDDEDSDDFLLNDADEDQFDGPKLVEIRAEQYERFSAMFETLLATYRSFVEYNEFLKLHQRYAQPSHSSAVNDLVNTLDNATKSLQQQFGSTLREVRSGRQPMEALDAFYDSAAMRVGELCSESHIAGQERCKVEFIARAVEAGATYLGFGQSLTPASFLADEVWSEHDSLVFETLATKAPVLLMDHDAAAKSNARRLEVPRLSMYVSSVEVTPDVLGEKEFLADKSLARSADRSSCTRNAQPPVARRVVRIPCPSTNCDAAVVHSWICAKCHHVLEYGYSDTFIYCSCGRSPAKTFEFRCSKSGGHGSAFVQYADQSRLEQLLLALPSSDYVNILLLGETGVGKSTFINAFINYMSFDTLDEALVSDQLHSVIPCSFSTQVMDRSRPGGKITEHRVVVGKRDDESDGSRGNSATQQTSVYPINIGSRTYRLIDTPGVGDTRGPNADRKNMADILATINSYEELHGILILLKSNNSRLTVTFRFCIQELLTHLHRDALNNIVFGFTNTRISNYTPGDTFGPLKTLLEQHPDINLPLNGDTTYCFDSESFRYLAAQRQGVEMENIDSFRRSWKHSSEEANRLINYFRSRQPHLVTNTISLNGTRQLILGLTKPMAEIAQLIQQNIIRCQAQEKEIADRRVAGEDLRKRLQIQKVLLKSRPLAMPRTVCADRNCIEVKDNGGQQVTVYKSHCHPECYLSGVRVEAIGQPGLIYCAAFNGHTCKRCNHHWRNHLHVMYELESYTTTMTDAGVQKQLNSNADDARVREQALKSIKQQVSEYQQEHDRVQRAAAIFGAYLRAKSISAYNDATAEYLEELIRLETEISAVSGDKTKLDMLRQDLKCHEELVTALTRGTPLPDEWKGMDTTLNEASIDKLVQEMYALKHFGAQLRDIHRTVKQSHQATYRERPYHVKQRKRSGTSPTRKPSTKSSNTYLPAFSSIAGRFGFKSKSSSSSSTASAYGSTPSVNYPSSSSSVGYRPNTLRPSWRPGTANAGMPIRTA
ncbi:hypothetical protein QBC34DRAFT_356708 [Podospora aff. communis PSN243]|uniref:G domain-containing protein n=1 Tax=Podospora aff. communis PSN243 TaxID=3040156 RepID=A0AAV9GG72_9PEZI|nr:hypothetical protein QBC34DRAFT_356708 [Podospora aff. communis PSN243]